MYINKTKAMGAQPTFHFYIFCIIEIQHAAKPKNTRYKLKTKNDWKKSGRRTETEYFVHNYIVFNIVEIL